MVKNNGQIRQKKMGQLPTNCLSVFDHFVGLVLNGLYIVVFQIIFNAGNTWMLIFNADWT